MHGANYRRTLLIVLFLIQAYNYVDGWVLGLVLQDIKLDLKLTDTQLGFLTGIAFWLFYSVMGIPIARWADYGNRVTIISLTVAVWSAMVALCGTARSFIQLLFIRVGVATGEAGCIPPAHSLIADYFGRADRPRAVSLYMLAGPVSMLFGYFLGGWLNQLYGWRTTFLIVGLPGLGLAALAKLVLKEPRLKTGTSSVVNTVRQGERAALREVCRSLWAISSFRHLLMSFSVVSFFVSGITQWQPAFFVRSFGARTGELGSALALIYGLGGMLGTYACGTLASRYAANNERLQLKVMAILTCFFGAFSAAVYMAPNLHLAYGSLAVAAIGGAAVSGPVFATIQTLVPEHMRATSIALIYLCCNLVGTGLGPLAAGVLSDGLRASTGNESLRYALLILCPGYFWGAWHLWKASTTVMQNLEARRSAT
jgi:MFS transporter, Spinster family, sphingosine-1-phosphate transporter